MHWGILIISFLYIAVGNIKKNGKNIGSECLLERKKSVYISYVEFVDNIDLMSNELDTSVKKGIKMLTFSSQVVYTLIHVISYRSACKWWKRQK